jgi:hypothetical protein
MARKRLLRLVDQKVAARRAVQIAEKQDQYDCCALGFASSQGALHSSFWQLSVAELSASTRKAMQEELQQLAST